MIHVNHIAVIGGSFQTFCAPIASAIQQEKERKRQHGKDQRAQIHHHLKPISAVFQNKNNMPRIGKSSGTSRSYPILPMIVCTIVVVVVMLRLGQPDDYDLLSLSPQPSSIASRMTTTSSSTPTKKKLADGCFHVFLDAGANIGIHGRFLLEPEKYPKAANAITAFESAFGPTANRDARDFCVFAFEPNPAHRQRQAELQKAYAAMGWRYHPIEAGLGDVEGDTLTFYHNDPGKSNSEWGFSVVNRRNNPNLPKEEVPSLHFARWIQKEIIGRKMPEKVYGQYDNQHTHNNGQEGKVALKLDIEGSEFLVAPSLLYTGVMCKAIDLVWGEFHASGHIPSREPLDPITGQGELKKFPDDWKVPKK